MYSYSPGAPSTRGKQFGAAAQDRIRGLVSPIAPAAAPINNISPKMGKVRLKNQCVPRGGAALNKTPNEPPKNKTTATSFRLAHHLQLCRIRKRIRAASNVTRTPPKGGLCFAGFSHPGESSTPYQAVINVC